MTGKRRGTGRMAALAMAGAFALASLLVAVPARADVIEIAPDGTVVTYKGPTLFEGGQGQPIRRPARKLKRQPARPDLSAGRASVRVMQPSHDVGATLDAAAAFYGLNPALVRAVAWRESRFRMEAVSARGAIGLMQLMPGTARELGVDPHDLQQNAYGGVAYLARMLVRFGGDLRLALAAYNAGPEAVVRHNGVPPFRETQDYVRSILAHLHATPDGFGSRQDQARAGMPAGTAAGTAMVGR
jgi:Transglycosylase SLT domain